MAATAHSTEQRWLSDSGATHHMTHRSDIIHGFRRRTGQVRTAGSDVLEIHGEGFVTFTINDQSVTLFVLWVPNISDNLLATIPLVKKGVRFTWAPDGLSIIWRPDFQVNFPIIRNRVTVVASHPTVRFTDKTCDASALAATTLDRLRHEAFGHPGRTQGRAMSKSLPDCNEFRHAPCEACDAAKLHKASLPSVTKRAKSSTPLEMLHVDIMTQLSGNSCCRYALVVVDDATSFVHVHPLKNKGQAFDALVDFVAFSETQTQKQLRVIRSDNDAVFSSHNARGWQAQKGILWERAVPYDSRQNGTVERMQRTLRERMQAALIGRQVSYSLWPEAIEFAATCLNLVPSPERTPFQAFYNRDPRVLARFLKPFGCLAWVFVPPDKRQGGKGGPRGIPAIFLGFDVEHRGWKFFSPHTSPGTFWSNSARFYEDRSWHERRLVGDWAALLDQPQFFVDDSDEVADLRYNRFDLMMEDDPDARRYLDSDLTFSPKDSILDGDGFDHVDADDLEIDVPAPAALAAAVTEQHPTIKAALSGPQAPEWRQAIEKEIQGLHDMGTFQVVDTPQGVRPIDSKLVLKLILDENNLPEKFKARMVALGNKQKKGRDFTDTFSPVAPSTAVRTALALAVAKGWEIHATDFTQAYLNGSIDHDLYLKPPRGSDLPPGKCYRIVKGLYGLKQAGRIWNQHLDALLRELGFGPCPSGACVYRKGSADTYCAAIVYVDDILLLSPSLAEVSAVKRRMQDKWKMTDKGTVTQFCGIHFRYDQERRFLILHQRPFIDQLLEEFLPDAVARRSPMDAIPGPATVMLEQKPKSIFQKLIGKLTWLANNTRMDCTFPAGVLARYMSKPGDQHLSAAKRVLQFLSGTKDLALVFSPHPNDAPLEGFTDANWASDPHVGRRSTSGMLIKVFGCTVSWRSQIQKCVALSAVEAELVAACEAAREMVFVKNLLDQLGADTGTPHLRTDSLGCIQVAKDPAQHYKLKHIDVKYNFLREKVQAGALSVAHVKSDANPADVFTKAVGRNTLEGHRRALGLEHVL